jgi:hypothetical protein
MFKSKMYPENHPFTGSVLSLQITDDQGNPVGRVIVADILNELIDRVTELERRLATEEGKK